MPPNHRELTQISGAPISVNLSRVLHWQPAGEGTMIVFGARGVKVKESYDSVSEALNPERQAEVEWVNR